jgi:hypothetical protein
MLLALFFGTTLLAGCNESGNTTIINQGLDCELIRDDLVGDWTVDLASANRTLQNCTGLDPGISSTNVTIGGFPGTYGGVDGVDIFGSDGSTSFKIIGDRTDVGDDPTISEELTGSVQADSCLAIVRVWAETTTQDLYVQCIGAFNINNWTLSGSCDSAEIDSNGDGWLDTSCSLDSNLSFDASIN